MKLRGFTIMELMIVIVVIAILAAISVAAYSGIQDRARTSSTQLALTQIRNAAVEYEVVQDGLPDVASTTGRAEWRTIFENAGWTDFEASGIVICQPHSLEYAMFSNHNPILSPSLNADPVRHMYADTRGGSGIVERESQGDSANNQQTICASVLGLPLTEFASRWNSGLNS